jgi:hypothetical protein
MARILFAVASFFALPLLAAPAPTETAVFAVG